jgi:2-haloacid dehalogenase
MTGEALDHALAMHGATDALLRARLMQAMLQPPAFTDAPPALAALRATGRRLALLTDTSSIMVISQTKSAKVFAAFDALLTTAAAGAVKPQAEAYRLVAQRFGVEAPRVLYASAQAWDVAGAAAAGLTTVWVNRAGDPPEHAWAPPAATVASLTELALLLPAPATP